MNEQFAAMSAGPSDIDVTASVAQPRQRTRVEVDDADVRRLYVEDGQSAPKVAAALGCSVRTVYYRLARLGVLDDHSLVELTRGDQPRYVGRAIRY